MADGKATHSGKVASAVAIAAWRTWLQKSPGDMLHVLGSAISSASDGCMKRSSPSGIGWHETTLTAMLWWDGHTAMCHIGDSRDAAADGALYQITHDHTHVQVAHRRGSHSRRTQLKHPRRSVLLRVLDGRPVSSRTSAHGARRDVTFCSNGLSNESTTEAARDDRGRGPRDRYAPADRTALHGGSRDSVTCIVADVVDTTTTERTPPP